MDTATGALRPTRGSAPRVRNGLVTLLTALAVAGLGLVGPSSSWAASAGAVTAQGPAPALAPDTYERRVHHWVNRRRESHGLRALRPQSCAERVAEQWSSYLVVNNEFLHQSMTQVLDLCNARYAGETLGRGTMTPRRLVRMWMHSEGHRAVLLNPKARRIGIGAKPDAAGRWVVAATFLRL